MNTKLLILGISTLIGSKAFAQNQPDSIHIELHENKNGTIRILDTIVPISQQQSLFIWMEANGWEAPPPPPLGGPAPAEFEHVIIIEGDSGNHPQGERRMIIIEDDGGGEKVGRHPMPPPPPGSSVEVTMTEKDTVINGKTQKMIIRTEKIILPPNPPIPPSPDRKPENGGQKKELAVYPNPSTSVINVEFDIVAKEKTTLRVLDSNGKIVYSEVIVEDQSRHMKKEINLAGKSKGAYTVEVESKNKIVAERVILQ